MQTINKYLPKILNPLTFTLSVIIIVLISFYNIGTADALGTAKLVLSPASGTYLSGSTLKVTINVISSDEINGAQAVINYDTSKLQYISIDTSATAFTFSCISSGGNGTVDVACANLSTLTGTKTLGSVNFKVLGSSGTTGITFKSTSGIARPSDGANVWDGSSIGGTYSLSTTTSTPPTTTTPTPTSTPKPSTPTQTPTTSKPKSDSTTPTSEPVTDIPKEVIGYLVAIQVLDSDGNPIVGKSVTLHNKTSITDDTGYATFSNIPAGKYTATDENGKTLASIDVIETNLPNEVQQFVSKPGFKINPLFYQIPIATIIGLIILGFLKNSYTKFRFNRLNMKRHFPPNVADSTIKIPKLDNVAGGQVIQAGQTIEPTTATTQKPVVIEADKKIQQK